MKLLFIVYVFTGFVIPIFVNEWSKKGVTLKDAAILLAIQIPAVLLMLLGAWQTKKVGKFFGMDGPLFMIGAAICYAVGIGLGFYADF
ncbi:MAG TPA: hypothetical protein VEQ85_01085 [Lacipirellulaceae bacterium]|nr:hypothetical protein [Lacipirellulaceae bacterium]